MSIHAGRDRDRRREHDRRAQPRRVAAGRVVWRRMEDVDRRLGWLSDESASSLSFIVSACDRPALREHIELSGRDRRPRRYVVTRIADYDANLALVAARDADDTRADA